MLETGGGSIVNMSSMVALIGSATPQTAYAAAKGGVLAMTREVAITYARSGIRCNALCPGPVDTPLFRNALAADEGGLERRMVHIPMGRLGRVRRHRRRRPLPGERRVGVDDGAGARHRRRDHRGLHDARMRADVAIVGAGLFGSSLAVALAREGMRVELHDKANAGLGRHRPLVRHGAGALLQRGDRAAGEAGDRAPGGGQALRVRAHGLHAAGRRARPGGVRRERRAGTLPWSRLAPARAGCGRRGRAGPSHRRHRGRRLRARRWPGRSGAHDARMVRRGGGVGRRSPGWAPR